MIVVLTYINSFQTFQKIDDIRKMNKIKIINKNCPVMKNNSSNQNININNNFNQIKIIYKNKSKNTDIKKNNQNNMKPKLKNKLIWNQSQIINNIAMLNSPMVIKKININEKFMKSNGHLKKASNNISKKGRNSKKQNNCRINPIDKNNFILNKLSLTSIRRKKTFNTYINHSKANSNNSPNSMINQS